MKPVWSLQKANATGKLKFLAQKVNLNMNGHCRGWSFVAGVRDSSIPASLSFPKAVKPGQYLGDLDKICERPKTINLIGFYRFF